MKKAKEKAKELISKFTFLSIPESNSKFYNPKQCALVAVNEILEECSDYILIDKWMPPSERVYMTYDERLEFWEEVKKELENFE